MVSNLRETDEFDLSWRHRLLSQLCASNVLHPSTSLTANINIKTQWIYSAWYIYAKPLMSQKRKRESTGAVYDSQNFVYKSELNVNLTVNTSV